MNTGQQTTHIPVRVFANETSVLRLVSAIEMEISEDRVHGKRYLDMSVEMESEDESPPLL